jgi:hypothetical protein
MARSVHRATFYEHLPGSAANIVADRGNATPAQRAIRILRGFLRNPERQDGVAPAISRLLLSQRNRLMRKAPPRTQYLDVFQPLLGKRIVCEVFSLSITDANPRACRALRFRMSAPPSTNIVAMPLCGGVGSGSRLKASPFFRTDQDRTAHRVGCNVQPREARLAQYCAWNILEKYGT